MKRTFSSILLVLVIVLMSVVPVAANTTTTAVDPASAAALQAVVDEAQPSIKALSDSLGDTFSIAISAHETSLVYTFRYNMPIDNPEVVAESLKEGILSQRSVYEMLVDQLELAGVKNASVIVRYLSQEGETIYAVRFGPNEK